jgi:GNAT-like C-terminal domain/N-acyltransferase N-terminal domain
VDAARVSAWLGSDDDEIKTFVSELERIGPPAEEVGLPDPDECPALYQRLGIRDDDAAEITATTPSPNDDPELWWLLQRSHQTLVAGMGDLEWSWLRWPHLPPGLGSRGRFFYVHVLLASVPAVLRYHEKRGIPEDTSWATLADLGRQLAIYRRIHGVGGLGVQFWFSLHFRGLIYDLGRLQFNRGRISFSDDAIAAADVPFTKADTALGVHIPESGPMTPEGCTASFERARAFYDQYFGEEGYRYAVCSSWLLDPQLAEYLPEDSNIVRFQRRFQLMPGGHDGDKAVFEFVLRKLEPTLDDIPRRTTLERAIAQHMEAGRHWEVREGWLAL